MVKIKVKVEQQLQNILQIMHLTNKSSTLEMTVIGQDE